MVFIPKYREELFWLEGEFNGSNYWTPFSKLMRTKV